MKKRAVLLCYDIADPARLARVHRTVSRHMWMLQYSAYYAVMEQARLRRLVQALERIIDPQADDVRVYAVEPLEHAVRLGRRGVEGMLLLEGGAVLLGDAGVA